MEQAVEAKPGAVHFVHVMKTGGTSFVARARALFAEDEVWPRIEPGDRIGEGLYGDAGRLRDLSDQERRTVRFYAGHHPFVATELSGAATTMTVLRDPVDRTISVLRHLRRHDPALADLSLEQVYDDIWKRAMFVWEYQVRQFAKRLDEDLRHVAGITVETDTVDRALDNLDRVDLIGLHADYATFEREAAALLGWPPDPFPHLEVSTGAAEVPEALRERIVADNPADVEFYRRAVELHARRTLGHAARP